MRQRLVLVCASAGGVEALGRLVRQLPEDLPATVLVALHLSSTSPSLLPQILARHSTLPVVAAADGAMLRPGTVVVSVPDRHLLVCDGHLVLGRGATENSHRPSHDAMLRSAALAAGPGVIGIVLTGLLDDGSAGLRCVHRYGGTCFVQDPDDADFPDMPRNAALAVPEAKVLRIEEMGAALVDALSSQPDQPPEVASEQRQLDELEVASALGDSTRLPDGSVPGEPSPFACPNCHGVLMEIPDEAVVRFRCRTGHAWTADSLLARGDGAVEEAIWSAIRALEERIDISNRLAERAERGGQLRSAASYRERVEESSRAVETLRVIVRDAAAGAPPVAS